MNLCDIRTIKQIMSVFGLSFKKEFGQNFLTDASVVERIADECCDGISSNILEIGPGIGTLTYKLAERYNNVVSVEIDNTLIPVLEYTLNEFNNVNIINNDIMKADLNEICAPYIKDGLSVCANLPYYITTPILTSLIESEVPFDYITVMVQSEVADRLCSAPGSKDCGAITAFISFYGTAEKLFKVPSGLFVPQPKVDSTVVRIKLYKDKPYKPLDKEIFFRTIKGAFGQRRKTLANALTAVYPELQRFEISDFIVSCGLSADVRGERLTLDDFTRLSDIITQKISK